MHAVEVVDLPVICPWCASWGLPSRRSSAQIVKACVFRNECRGCHNVEVQRPPHFHGLIQRSVRNLGTTKRNNGQVIQVFDEKTPRCIAVSFECTDVACLQVAFMEVSPNSMVHPKPKAVYNLNPSRCFRTERDRYREREKERTKKTRERAGASERERERQRERQRETERERERERES